MEDQGFWVLDDALAVWLGYLIDQAERVADPWLAERAEDWRGTPGMPRRGGSPSWADPGTVASAAGDLPRGTTVRPRGR
ncbi:hypothetical protein GCM10022267_66380 [Lentzea roselyniae]|uniref:Uncharacterized protein n=1 Tax=Lentzea roselyniae TaxID=531940 RepID=A0ABP7BX10_9PSEU